MTDYLLVSFVVITHQRTEDAIEAIESILSQEYSNIEVTVVVSPVGNTYEKLSSRYADEPAVGVNREQERGGVAAARNKGFERATGDLYVILDDDAVFEDDRATNRIVDQFNNDPDLGALAFRSVDYATGEVRPVEIPRGSNGKQPSHAYETTYFVGVGAAFQADVIDDVGGFPDDFFYYMEELDLSFAILRAGYRIHYDPSITVLHKASEGSRPEGNVQWRLILENRIRVAVRYLPWRHAIVSTIIWICYVLYRTKLSPLTIITAVRNVFADKDTLIQQRTVIDTETLKHIKELNGRLWN